MSAESYLKNTLGELTYANCVLVAQLNEQAARIASLQAELETAQSRLLEVDLQNTEEL